ncbi:methionine ABC transporter substrate-binding lipoprotein MetQ [Sphingobacterium pedocola]|uniref:Lipoprotein n=1 Tax=Sphingobacterium pedocola TaxID=2082722 RepID=A0ABR9T6P8_9SPHI|nr:methionine ABC transporter substrate-binding lipoprotein MetQ [Sphingobacterium pedocola]MBE8720998.1 methionine ABC transporter substrate-binding protein MetQ [Sphingobacterium pedocola]
MHTAFKSIIGLMAIAITLSCSSNSNNENILKVGVQSGPEYVLAETAKKVAKEKYNLDVELVTFNDYVMPNEALRQKDIDANVFQNKPYLDVQAKNRGYDFAILGNTFVYPMAGYSKKITSIDQLKNEDTVVIPNDPTNLGRALLLLQEVGLIKLKEGNNLLPTLQDITENKKNLRILELEAPQLPRTLDDDKVAVAVINNNFAASHQLTAKKDGIFVESGKSPYVNVIVSRKDNKDDVKLADFVKSYQSEEVVQAAEEAFKGGAIKGW